MVNMPGMMDCTAQNNDAVIMANTKDADSVLWDDMCDEMCEAVDDLFAQDDEEKAFEYMGW